MTMVLFTPGQVVTGVVPDMLDVLGALDVLDVVEALKVLDLV